MAHNKRPNTVKSNTKARQTQNSAKEDSVWPVLAPWLFAAALLAAVFAAYYPAWDGTFIWDDDLHLLDNPVLQPGGWLTTWNPLAHVNFWPLTSTVYRIEYALWDLDTLGYHLVNIGLHAISALLVWRLLVRLRIPGAMLAAALFALHPVNVESVAWITQLKNVLSLMLALLATLCYLRFERKNDWWQYGFALVLFLLSCLSKGMTLTLPIVLLACVWWQRGRITWRDVLLVVPFLMIAGMMTGIEVFLQTRSASVAHEVVRTDNLFSRTAIAGWAVWFYLWKLVWPFNLLFVYPRWPVGSLNVLSFVPGFTLAGILALAWWRRRTWGRPVVMLLVCYVGLLLPALGFANIYFMRFSLVADHWQYAAMIAPCAAAAALGAMLIRRQPWLQMPGFAFSVALLAGLAFLTFEQSKMYADVKTLYRTTIAANPNCWLAENNLANVLNDEGDAQGAIEHYQKALEIKPDLADAHYNIGVLLNGLGRTDEAIERYRKAVECKPKLVVARTNLAILLAGQKRFDEAFAQCEEAIKVPPPQANAYYTYGNILAESGKLNEALDQYRKALEIVPTFIQARHNSAMTLRRLGRNDESITEYRKVLEIHPDFMQAHYNLANGLAARGEWDAAIAHFQAAAQLAPNLAEARRGLTAAKANRAKMLQFNDAAWRLATDPSASVRDGAKAVRLAEQAVRLSGGRSPAILGTLAAAQAEAGRFDEAVATARKAVELAVLNKQTSLAQSIQAKIPLYQARKPFRQSPSPSERRKDESR